MNPVIGASLIEGGGAILGGIGSWLGGSQDRKRKEQLYKYVMGMLRNNSDIINPSNYMWARRSAVMPQMNQLGASLDRKYGFDSGRASGALSESLLASDAGAYGEASMENVRMKEQRKQYLLSSLMGMYGGS